MKLAVSNIAWTAEDDRVMMGVLAGSGVAAIEAAPARLFGDPLETPDAEARRRAAAIRDAGFDLVAFQSLLFGVDGVALFGSDSERRRLGALLTKVIGLAGAMSVPVLVFGAPSVRRVPDGMLQEEAFESARRFFAELAPVAADHGTTICIEPNPTRYGCNFVTTSDEGADLVRAVGEPGFGLHLDAAGMTLAGEEVRAALARHAAHIHHFHVSAPDLGPLEEAVVDHAAVSAGLRDGGYDRTLSIEMRSAGSDADIARVLAAVELVQTRYHLSTSGAIA